MKNNYRKNTGISFILSLILHIIIAVALGLFILESEHERIQESIAVEMVNSAKRVLPVIHLRNIEKKVFSTSKSPVSPQIQFDIQNIKVPKLEFSGQSLHPGMKVIFPELGTSTSKLKTDFEITLPDKKGIEIEKPGSGKGKGMVKSGSSPTNILDGSGIFELALNQIAKNIANKNKTGKEDIVFLIDASGSMEENILAVSRYIYRMIEIFIERGIDFSIGVIRYNRILKENDITIYEQTKDINRVRAILRSIRCQGDESTFDAIEAGLKQVKFRDQAEKTFVIVTDESFKPRTIGRIDIKKTRKELIEQDFQDILKLCIENRVKINIMGIDDELHKAMTKETGGLWFQIPASHD